MSPGVEKKRAKARRPERAARRRLERGASKKRRLPGDLALDRDEIERSLCRKSFYDFVRRFWHEVEPAKPVWNWHVRELCDAMQVVAERVFRGEAKPYDLVINVPPGSTKSLICSVFFPAWVWTRMAAAKIIAASYSQVLSLDLARKSRLCVKSVKYGRLFPGVVLSLDQDAKGFYATTAQGWRLSTSESGTVTGFHAHFVIVDDPLDPNRAFSEAELKSAIRWVRETLPSRVVDKKVSVMILIMQRLHQGDPSAVLLKEAKSPEGTPVKHYKLPASVEGHGRKNVRPRRLARYYRGDPGAPSGVTARFLDPVRLGHQSLTRFLVKAGRYAHSGQMQQDPIPSEGGMFETDKLRKYPARPVPGDFKNLTRFWDKAGTAGGGAFTAGVLMGEHRDGSYWVLDVKRGQWGTGKREAKILETAEQDARWAGHGDLDRGKLRVLVGLEQEPGSGGKESAEETAKRVAKLGIRCKVTRPTGKKEARADPFSVQVNLGNVRVVEVAGITWVLDYVEELQNFPNSDYKDQVDATSGAYTVLCDKKNWKAGGLWGAEEAARFAQTLERGSRR